MSLTKFTVNYAMVPHRKLLGSKLSEFLPREIPPINNVFNFKCLCFENKEC